MKTRAAYWGLACDLFRELGLVPDSVECCASCHHEEELVDEGIIDVMPGCAVYVPDGQGGELEFLLCCNVHTFWKAQRPRHAAKILRRWLRKRDSRYGGR